MFRKRFIALVMALTMLFTLMAPAFTFAVGEGDPDPDQTTHSETGEQLPGNANQGGNDADKGGDQGNGDANVGAGDQGNGDANVGEGDQGNGDANVGEGDANNTRGDEGSEGTFDVIVVEGIRHGTVTANKTKAKVGDTVTLTVTPKEGYATGEVQIKYGDNDPIEITPTDGVYSFSMPAGAVRVTAIFDPIYYSVETVAQPGDAGIIEAVGVSDGKAACDSTVTLTVTPEEGFALESLTVVNDTTGQTLEVAENSFTMPASSVTVTAVFATTTVTVTFKKGPDDPDLYTVTVNKGEVIPADVQPVNPELEDDEFTFVGWYINNDPDEAIIDLTTQTFNEDTTLFAKWEAVPAPSVAQIGEIGYESLQAAIDAAYGMTGNVTVTLLTDTTEVVKVVQNKNLNLVITGNPENKPTLTGTIKIDGISGGSSHNGTDTLIISNIKIVYNNNTTTSKKSLIYFMVNSELNNNLGSQHNVTIKNCELEGGQNGISDEIYAVRIGSGTQSKNITLRGLTVKNTYCLLNSTGVVGLTVDGCNATAVKNGININGGEGNLVIENNVIEAVGYAYRSGSTGNGSAVLKGNTFIGNGTDNDEGAVVVRDQSGTNRLPVTIENGFYKGEIKAIDANKLLTITGGYFTVIPDLAFCGQDAQGQLYPMASDNAAYPYTVGHPVALLNDGLGYATFAAAAAARTSDDDVITLLANITEGPYALAEGKTLKVRKGDYTLAKPTVPDGCNLVVTEPTDGVTTYTAKVVPPLPEAEIVNITGTEKAHKNIVEYELVENDVQQTGKTIAKLDAEYEFVLDPDPETIQAQKDEYAYWCCDFLVSFDADMEANSFGLFGAYAQYGAYAFKFPENVRANEEFPLVSWLGQKILGGNGFDIRFVDIMDIDFFCGVYNLSAKNCGKTMTVKLVMWDPKNPNDIKVRDTVTYTFPTPKMPDAEVTDVTGAHTNIDEYVFTVGSYDVTGTVEELDAEYLFKLKLDTDEREAALQSEYYANWRCDYVVSFDDNMTANSFGLFGAYGPYEVAFQFPENIAANNEFKLCEWIAQKTGLQNSFTIKFSDIISFVQGKFYCGVYNLSDDNLGKTMTVKLVMWDPENPNDLKVRNTQTYYFGDPKPLLPEATVTEIKPAAEGVSLYVLPDIVNPTGETADLDAEYKFTAVEPTEAQLAYYGDWRADYRVTFSDNMTAESFGLYGAYAGYDIAFKYPANVTEPVYLLSGVDDRLTYAEVWENVTEFTCGVFNLDNANAGKKMTVELVIWDPEAPEKVYTIAEVEYEFVAHYNVELASQDTAGNTSIVTLQGGGDYVSGEEATVTAPDKEGYSFVGWFEDSFSDNNLKSENQSYAFTVEGNIKLIAVYQVAPTAKADLHVFGSLYTISYPSNQAATLQPTDADFDVPLGETVTANYTGTDFLYWVNYSGNIVSTEETFDFVMVGETTISVVTSVKNAMQTGKTIVVVFLNGFNQVLATQRMSDPSDWTSIKPPANPSRMGHTFEDWYIADENGKPSGTKATAASIFALATDDNPVVKIVPLFILNGYYTLNVSYSNSGTVELYDTYSIDAGVTKAIQASEIAEAKGLSVDDFRYWTLNGTIVSYADSYTVVATGGKTMELVAVFSTESVTKQAAVAITQMYPSDSNGNHKVSITMSYYVPEQYTVQKSGFVYAGGPTCPALEDFVLESVGAGKGVYKHITSEVGNSVIYTMNTGLKNNDTSFMIYARAFVVYTDQAGEIYTIYSPIHSGSYDSLSN